MMSGFFFFFFWSRVALLFRPNFIFLSLSGKGAALCAPSFGVLSLLSVFAFSLTALFNWGGRSAWKGLLPPLQSALSLYMITLPQNVFILLLFKARIVTDDSCPQEQSLYPRWKEYGFLLGTVILWFEENWENSCSISDVIYLNQ